jgi:hypothetical protein
MDGGVMCGLYEQPFARDINKVYEPIIWVTSPAAGEKIKSPFTLRGMPLSLKPMSFTRLKDAGGNTLAEGFTTAEAGAPERGDFETSVAFTPSPAGRAAGSIRDQHEGREPKSIR